MGNDECLMGCNSHALEVYLKKMEYTLLMLVASMLIRMEQCQNVRGVRFLCISFFIIHSSFCLVGFPLRLLYKNAAVILKLKWYMFAKIRSY